MGLQGLEGIRGNKGARGDIIYVRYETETGQVLMQYNFVLIQMSLYRNFFMVL